MLGNFQREIFVDVFMGITELFKSFFNFVFGIEKKCNSFYFKTGLVTNFIYEQKHEIVFFIRCFSVIAKRSKLNK